MFFIIAAVVIILATAGFYIYEIEKTCRETENFLISQLEILDDTLTRTKLAR